MKRLFKILLSVSLAAVALLTGCSPQGGENGKDGTCRVVLAESRHYSSTEYVKEIKRGGDVEFTVNLERGYLLKSADYVDCEIKNSPCDGEGRVTSSLILRNVRYPVYVSPELAEAHVLALNQSDKFRCEERVKAVENGAGVTFELFFKDNYTFKSASGDGGIINYNVTGADGDADENGERRVTFTVENVRSSANVTVIAKNADGTLEPIEDAAVIGYFLNGGEYLNGDSGSYYTRSYALGHYPRPNVSVGTDVIKRDGYTLVGWNTLADGSGEHIGLGRRAPVGKNQILSLYAEWEKWSEPALFEYVLINSDNARELYMEKKDKQGKLSQLVAAADSDKELSAVITGYRGGLKKMVIPAEVDGFPVEVISSGACAADKDLQTVIFPSSTYYIMEQAFINCSNFTEIYLYDSLNYVDYNAFGTYSNIKTMHINAKLPPIYGENESAQLANKLEFLMRNEDEEKTVIFGSCSSWYGIHAKTFGEETGRLTFNMGVEGDTCVLFQLDLIKRYMRDGDTLVYVCDIGSPFLMLCDLSLDQRTYRLVEFNYDLLAFVDLTRYEKVIPSLNEYLVTKRNALELGKAGTYEDHLDYMSEYGDMEKERVKVDYELRYTAATALEMRQWEIFDKMKSAFREFTVIGIDIYCAFGTIDEAVITREHVEEVNELFYSEFAAKEVPATLVAELYSSVLSSKYFCDYPYRLNTEGSRYYTQLFIENFKSISV